VVGLLCIALVAGAFGLPNALLLAPVAFITFTYLVAGTYKAVMLARCERVQDTVAVDAYALLDEDLPMYTVLVPLYREGKFAPVLVKQLQTIEYPAHQLEVLLLVEGDDEETWRALEECALPSHMRIVGVPAGGPRTKPRALNVGLSWAQGKFIVVYDAEDQPERDQLRKAAAMFRALPRRVVCLQARLNFYNRHQSLLTRLFSMDYAIWYDMLLPKMTGKQTIVPLGGTSNHFRVEALRRLGGWDPYNVTEDADLGVRIARARLSVMMLDSVTWEEAVAHIPQWVRQRSRWIKGYMQTYLVHMRHPTQLLQQVGPRAFLDFQILVGGSSLILLVNPVMWALTIVYFLSKDTTIGAMIESLFPSALYYPALLCLLGNFIFLYSQLYICVKRGFDDLVRYTLLGPLYWILMSIGAWAGLVSLLRDPHYWAKTEHGESLALAHLGQNVTGHKGSFAAPTSLIASPFAPPMTVTAPANMVYVAEPDASLAVNTKTLSVVLPAYNEEALIASTLRTVVETLARWDLESEIIVVNDGSHDRTGEVVATLAARDKRIRLITHPVNRGYGAALVTGFESARNDLVFFMDSDGQFDFSELATFLQLMERFDTVWGYRRDRQDTLVRRLNAWGWKLLVRLFLGVSVRDVDCAFKLFRAEFFRTHQLETRGAMINAEMLYKLRCDGYSIVQVGVRHLGRKAGRATGARPLVIARAMKDLVICTWRWRVTRH
jgi:cellulose synthase/poly-beta-1,6-N-acetylglucosamine synthase-like glycosyltransferase